MKDESRVVGISPLSVTSTAVLISLYPFLEADCSAADSSCVCVELGVSSPFVIWIMPARVPPSPRLSEITGSECSSFISDVPAVLSRRRTCSVPGSPHSAETFNT